MAASSPHIAGTIIAPERHSATDSTRRRSPLRALVQHRRFALVLAGGGARGAAHIGVLRALEHDGYHPSAIVGVSMGAIVASVYALNPDWYRALVGVDLSQIPGLVRPSDDSGVRARLRAMVRSGNALRHLMLRWGALTHARAAIETVLRRLTLGKRLEEARVPLVIVATDLLSSQRVTLTDGPAAEAAYASSALAGILPPARRGDTLLADGAYADIAPVDVARTLGCDIVIVVNPATRWPQKVPRTGYQALVRAMEVSHHRHAVARIRQADLEIAPRFPFAIDTLDFAQLRFGVAAGARAVRAQRRELARLLARVETDRPPARPATVDIHLDRTRRLPA